jgi:hypothetical protein
MHKLRLCKCNSIKRIKKGVQLKNAEELSVEIMSCENSYNPKANKKHQKREGVQD